MIHNLELDNNKAKSELWQHRGGELLDEHIKISLLIHKYHRFLLKNLHLIHKITLQQRIDHLVKINQLQARLMLMGQEINRLNSLSVDHYSEEIRNKISVYVQQNKSNWEVLMQCIETYTETLILLNDQQPSQSYAYDVETLFEESRFNASVDQSKFANNPRYKEYREALSKNLESVYRHVYKKLSAFFNKTLHAVGRDAQGVQARTDEKYLKIIVQLKQLMANQEKAVYQIGAVLFVKVKEQEFCRVLTPREISAINQHPHLMQSPEDLLQQLPSLLAAAQKEEGKNENANETK